jgi:hypothetical protein
VNLLEMAAGMGQTDMVHKVDTVQTDTDLEGPKLKVGVRDMDLEGMGA